MERHCLATGTAAAELSGSTPESPSICMRNSVHIPDSNQDRVIWCIWLEGRLQQHLQQRRYYSTLPRQDRLDDWRVEKFCWHCDRDTKVALASSPRLEECRSHNE